MKKIIGLAVKHKWKLIIGLAIIIIAGLGYTNPEIYESVCHDPIIDTIQADSVIVDTAIVEVPDTTK